MKAVFQRVDSARVTAEGKTTGEIGPGCPDPPGGGSGRYAGACRPHGEESGGAAGVLRRTRKNEPVPARYGRGSARGIQFHLVRQLPPRPAARVPRGGRPETARPLYELFMQELRRLGVARVEAGLFGAHMQISMMGNGPVTIPLDTRDWLRTAP